MIACALVAGCGVSRGVEVRTVVETERVSCPPAVPDVPCPGWPDGDVNTLLGRDAIRVDGQAAHRICKASLGVVLAEIARCLGAESE